MSVLITEVKILDPQSAHHRKTVNVLIKEGLIQSIGTSKPRADQTIDGKGAYLSPGWFDLQANFNDPGNEHKEDLNSGRNLAAAGGFTEVALLPNTEPPIQTKNDVEYISRGNNNSLVQLFPIAAISKDIKGEDFTELHDLSNAGAMAFSDGIVPLWNTDLLRKSILYVQKFNGLVIDRPEDHWLAQFGVMSEGVNSALLGMKGIPHLSEEVIVDRDIKILQYTGGRLHLANLSTAKAVAAVRKAKKKGLNITCDVAIHQLLYTDDNVLNFDSNFKVSPPLRTQKDINGLVKGLKDGTIDAIVSSHQPQDEENKKLEYDLAADGMANMQVVLPMLNLLAKDVPLDLLIEKLTTGPRNILGRPQAKIEKGLEANLTLFNPKTPWTFDSQTNLSKSQNSPLFGTKVNGKVLAVFNNGQHVIL
jgi:dihydroorotase